MLTLTTSARPRMRESRARYASRSVTASGRQLGSIITSVSAGTSLVIRRSMAVAMGSAARATLPACSAVTPAGRAADSWGYSSAQAAVPAR